MQEDSGHRSTRWEHDAGVAPESVHVSRPGYPSMGRYFIHDTMELLPWVVEAACLWK